MAKQTVYVSIDVEATGDSPARGSMIMLGAVAMLGAAELCRYEECLTEDNVRGERCWEEFWSKHTDLFADIESRAVAPEEAMLAFSRWIGDLKAECDVKFIANPAAYDWMWLKFYYDKYAPEGAPDIGYKAECLDSLERALEILGLRRAYEARCAERSHKHTHRALDDARRQGWRHYCARLTLSLANTGAQEQHAGTASELNARGNLLGRRVRLVANPSAGEFIVKSLHDSSGGLMAGLNPLNGSECEIQGYGTDAILQLVE